MTAHNARWLAPLCLLLGCGESSLLDLPQAESTAHACDVGSALVLSPLDDFESTSEANFSYYANPDDPAGRTITEPPGADPNSAGLQEVNRCPGTQSASVYALHVAGGGYVTYGPNLGWTIGTTSAQARDYSAQSGVAFWARTDSSEPQVVTLTLQDAYTFPVDDAESRNCVLAEPGKPAPVLGTRCWNGGNTTRTLSAAVHSRLQRVRRANLGRAVARRQARFDAAAQHRVPLSDPRQLRLVDRRHCALRALGPNRMSPYALIRLAVTASVLGTTGCLGVANASSAEAAGLSECESGLIEDFEDGNHQLLEREGRGGFWYLEADEEGTSIEPDGEFEPSDGGALGSLKAGHIAGKTAVGSNVWAGMAVNLANPKQPYDASKYRAIAFYARRGKTGTSHIIVRVPDANTDPEGGVCKDCWNDFGAQLELTEQYRKYVLPFDELHQEPGWGEPQGEIDAKRLFGLKWQLKSAGQSYDIWVDDIRFVGCK